MLVCGSCSCHTARYRTFGRIDTFYVGNYMAQRYHKANYASNSSYSNRVSESWGDALTAAADDIRCNPVVCEWCECKDYPECADRHGEPCESCMSGASGAHKTLDRMADSVPNPVYDPSICSPDVAEQAFKQRKREFYNKALENNADTSELNLKTRDRRLMRRLWLDDTQRQALDDKLHAERKRLDELAESIKRAAEKRSKRRKVALQLVEALQYRPGAKAHADAAKRFIDLTGEPNDTVGKRQKTSS